jgi:succinoglycan biosynthesis transport protein ExoP
MNGIDTGGHQVSARDILTVVFRRKVAVTVVAVIVAAAALTAASRTSSVYEAAAKIFIRRTGPTPVATTWTPYYGLEEEMNTEVELVRSAEVMERAVEILKEKGLYYEQAVGDSIIRRAPTLGDVSAGLSARPVEMANVLFISYTGSSPRFVEAVANAAAEAYVEHRIEIRSSSGIQDYFKDQLALLEARLLELISLELKLRKEAGIYDMEWQYRAAISRRSEMEKELAMARSERLAEEEKLRLIRQRMKDNPDLLVPFAQFEHTKIGGQMLSEYWSLRRNRDEKAVLLTETNPEVRMLDERIQDMENRFAEEVERRIVEHEFLIEDLKAKEDGYLSTIQEISTGLKNTPDAYAQIKHLEKEIHYTYLHYEKMLENMLNAMASEANDMRLSNAKIISPATAHLTKVGKMQGLYVAFSILLGVSLGVGFGFLLENLDQSVKGASDIEDDLGVTLLGSVPEMKRLPRFTRRIDGNLGRKPQ